MLLPFFQWCNNTAIGLWTRGNDWGFPLIETFHILSLAVLLGCIALVDLRLLGLGLRQFSAPKLQRELNAYINWSLVVIIATGIPLFCSEALKAYDNDAFRPKIILLFLAIVFHYSVHRKTALDETPGGPSAGKAVAAISLVLWFGVGIMGRAIGFV